MNQAEVWTVEPLEHLHAELKRFAGEAWEPLRATEQEIRRTLEWLAERRAYWQAEVRRWEEIVEEAREAYARCRKNGGRCDRESEQLREAESQLDKARRELHTVERALKAVRETAEAYAVQARRLSAMLGNHVPRGIASLGRSLARLHSFLALRAPVASEGAVWDSDAAARQAHGEATRNLDHEYTFEDAQGRHILLTVHAQGDQCYVRAHDLGITPEVRRDVATLGSGGRANVLVERDDYGHIARVRLQDIEVNPQHRSAGIGSALLEEAERLAIDQRAAEIYGTAPDEPDVRTWYTNHGYHFRANAYGGEEVYKAFS